LKRRKIFDFFVNFDAGAPWKDRMPFNIAIRKFSEARASKWQLSRVARKAPLFRSMSRSALSRLLDNGIQPIYNPNDVIVKQGESDQSVYLVIFGRVRVMQSSAETATQVTIAELGPGEVFGELAILETQPRSATVLALERTSCLKVPGTEFLAALSQSAT
jgi:CRP-like cAMP-binding protein